MRLVVAGVLTLALAAAGCGGGGMKIDAEATVRDIVEQNVAKAGERATIDRVTCVDRGGDEWRCAVEVTDDDGTPFSVSGELVCQGGVGEDCVWTPRP